MNCKDVFCATMNHHFSYNSDLEILRFPFYSREELLAKV